MQGRGGAEHAHFLQREDRPPEKEGTGNGGLSQLLKVWKVINRRTKKSRKMGVKEVRDSECKWNTHFP